MATNEEKFDQGLAIGEMIKLEGWKLFADKVRERIEHEKMELRRFEIEGKGLQDIAAEYIRHRERLDAYEGVLEIINDFLAAKKAAQSHLS